MRHLTMRHLRGSIRDGVLGDAGIGRRLRGNNGSELCSRSTSLHAAVPGPNAVTAVYA